MEIPSQKLQFNDLKTKDGYLLDLFMNVKINERGDPEQISSILAEFVLKHELMSLVPLIEKESTQGTSLRNLLIEEFSDNGLSISDLEIIIFSTKVRDSSNISNLLKKHSSKYSLDELEAKAKKNKSFFRKLFKR